MPLEDLKTELLSYIQNSDDEQLLSLVKEDFLFYSKAKDADITDKLSDEQLKELSALAEENEMKDSITLEQFKQATQQWRTK